MKMKRHQFEITGSAAAIILLGGCSAFQPQAKLEIRSVETARQAADPSDPLAEGRGLLALGQNANAISAFRNALRENPNSGDAYNGLAIAYDRIGRQDLAQRYFELAVSADPENMRYRGNLARLFERNGQPKLALGLVAPPARTTETSANPAVPVPTSIVPASTPPFIAAQATFETVEAAIADPVTVPTLTDLNNSGPIAELSEVVHAPAAASPAVSPFRAEAIPAVYRPTAAMTIRPVAIEIGSLPKPIPQRGPISPSERQPFDMPRQAVMPTQREGIRLERVSLGEVRLVTRPSTPKLESKTDEFASFGVRLATWLPGAIAVERLGQEVRIAESPKLKDAIARAQIEKAIQEVSQDSEEIAELQTFTYAFFHNEGVEEVTLAAL
jgi:hypothetical protein